MSHFNLTTGWWWHSMAENERKGKKRNEKKVVVSGWCIQIHSANVICLIFQVFCFSNFCLCFSFFFFLKTNKCKSRINRASDNPHTFRERAVWTGIDGTEKECIITIMILLLLSIHSFVISFYFASVQYHLCLGVNLRMDACVYVYVYLGEWWMCASPLGGWRIISFI